MTLIAREGAMVLHALVVVGLLVAGLASGRLSAAPFSYDETLDGDLTDNYQLAPTFALDAGVNTVSGTALYTVTSADFDQFAFTVPEGHVLTRIVFSYEVALVPGTEALATYYDLLDGLPFADGTATLGRHELFLFVLPPFTVEPSPSDLFTGALPLGPGSYWMFNEALARGGPDESTGGDWRYRWELRVAAASVPEPPALFILGPVLSLLVVRRRHQRGTADRIADCRRDPGRHRHPVGA